MNRKNTLLAILLLLGNTLLGQEAQYPGYQATLIVFGIPIIIGLLIAFGAIRMLNLKVKNWITISVSIILALLVIHINLKVNNINLIAIILLSIIGSGIGIFVLARVNNYKEKKLLKSQQVIKLKPKEARDKSANNSKLKDESNYEESNLQNRKITTPERITPTQKAKSKITTDEIFELKVMISDNKLDQAINKMIGLAKNKEFDDSSFNELVILRSRYVQVKASSRKGVLSNNEENLEVNKIRDRLLEFIDSIKNI